MSEGAWKARPGRDCQNFLEWSPDGAELPEDSKYGTYASVSIYKNDKGIFRVHKCPGRGGVGSCVEADLQTEDLEEAKAKALLFL